MKDIYNLIENLGAVSIEIKTVSLQRHKLQPEVMEGPLKASKEDLEYAKAWQVDMHMPNEFGVYFYKFKDDKTTLFDMLKMKIRENAISQKEAGLKKIYELNEILAKLD